MTAYGETSTTDPGSKSAAEIEREVKQERAHVERTLDELQERFSPGQLVDQAVTYLRGSGGADFMRNLGEAVKHNPLPLALVGVGVAWMMLGDRSGRRDRYARPSYWGEDDDLASDAELYEADLYYEDAGVTTAAYGTGAATSAGDENGEGWTDRAKATVEGAKDKAAELGERARGLAEDATAGVGRLSATARERLARARELAARGAGDGRARASRYGRRARQGFLHTLDEHPLVLGAIGLALGAALGSALPPSESEDRLLGETRDRFKRQAVKTGHEQVKKAEAAAGAAYDAAREEAERQGLTPQAMRQAAEEATAAARQKVERVGEAAASAARNEVEGTGSEPKRDTA